MSIIKAFKAASKANKIALEQEILRSEVSSLKGVPGWKALNWDFTCRGFQYTVGHIHKEENKDKIRVCYNGLHFCTKAEDVIYYYDGLTQDVIFAEVIGYDVVEACSDDSKVAARYLEIVREVPYQEFLNQVINNGKRNAGIGNDGFNNSGAYNEGCDNSGDMNRGSHNSGKFNFGNSNIGDLNNGHSNVGMANSGRDNLGDNNIGDSNLGHNNIGDRNVGENNCGDKNCGRDNFGSYNVGNGNVGDYCVGDANFTQNAFGVCCTVPAKLMFFDAPSDLTMSDWKNHKSYRVVIQLFKDFSDVEVKSITSKDVKKMHREGKPALRISSEIRLENTSDTVNYKKIMQRRWSCFTPEAKKLITEIPNFNEVKFFELTGIEVKPADYVIKAVGTVDASGYSKYEVTK